MIMMMSRFALRLCSLVLCGLNVLYAPIVSNLQFVYKHSIDQLFLHLRSTSTQMMIRRYQFLMQGLNVLDLSVECLEQLLIVCTLQVLL